MVTFFIAIESEEIFCHLRARGLSRRPGHGRCWGLAAGEAGSRAITSPCRHVAWRPNESAPADPQGRAGRPRGRHARAARFRVAARGPCRRPSRRPRRWRPRGPARHRCPGRRPAPAPDARHVDRLRGQHQLALPHRPAGRAAAQRVRLLARPGHLAPAQFRVRADQARGRRLLAVAVRAVVAVPHGGAGRRPGLRPARLHGRVRSPARPGLPCLVQPVSRLDAGRPGPALARASPAPQPGLGRRLRRASSTTTRVSRRSAPSCRTPSWTR